MQSVRADKAVVEGIATAHGSVNQTRKSNKSIAYIAHCRYRVNVLHTQYRSNGQATEEAITRYTLNLT